MYYYLHGTPECINPGRVVIDCAGVGFDVTVSLSTYNEIKDHANPQRLFTYVQVGETILRIFGFYTVSERDMFLILISIHGVGPSMAMRLLSGMPSSELSTCIRSADVKKLKQIKGVGTKLADRLVAELKDKLGPALDTVDDRINAEICAERDSAVAGLVALGYKKGEATTIVDKVIKQQGIELSAEELVTRALQS